MVRADSPSSPTPEQEDVVARELRAQYARDNAGPLRAEYEDMLRGYQQGPHEAPLIEPREPKDPKDP